MISLLSWNIQNGKGVDGDVSLRRIADVIAAMGVPDVICLQEISRGLTLTDKAGTPDQVAELKDLFPSYEIVFGIAVDALRPNTGGRWQYGNAVLTKLPILLKLSHPLPRPGAEGVRHMLRQATEVVVASQAGPLRIVNLHLEFHSLLHRMTQVDRLRELQLEILQAQTLPPRTDPAGPYQAVSRPVDGVVCGDFNMRHGSPEYQRMLSPLDGNSCPFQDAWEIAHPGRPHDPTCGIYDRQQWSEGPHCRDFFFVTGRCVQAVSNVRVDTASQASDHQPLMLEMVDTDR